MENRTEHFLEEKIYCHTYDGLVREMASAMEVDSKKLFPNTEGEFDHEDIESWIGAVKFKEGKVPDIQASLSSDRGLNVIKFDVADQKGIGSLDEKATKEELVYSMALTEAKMKVVSDIAEEVYPAVAFQIKDYRREIERVREEILGDKRENTSLDEIIHGVMSKKTLAAAVIIGGMVLSACGVSIEIVTPNATATETQPRVTETVDIGVTETPFQPGVTETAPGVSETPTLEVTPTEEMTSTIETSPTPENIEYAEINKRIEDFLGSEGQYSDEALAELPHMGFDRKVALEGNYLGILKTVAWIDMQPYFNTENWSESEATQVFYQGVFLGGVLQNDRVVAFIGMKDRGGDRIIVPIGRTVYPDDGNTIVNMLTVGNFDGGSWDINNPGDSVEEIFASNADRLSLIHI